MHKSLNGALAVLGLAATTLALSGPASADGIGIGVHVGGIGVGVGAGETAYGYQDGYWDRGHHWHHWRNHREMREYRSAHRDQYYDYRHDRDPGDGWRD